MEAPNKEGVGHQHLAASLILVCERDGVVVTVSSASWMPLLTVPFKIKSSHCIGHLLMSFEQRLQCRQRLNFSNAL